MATCQSVLFQKFPHRSQWIFLFAAQHLLDMQILYQAVLHPLYFPLLNLDLLKVELLDDSMEKLLFQFDFQKLIFYT